VDGAKGLGKSTTSIYLAKKYIDKYSFICPKCGNEFFKNVYTVKTDKGAPVFYIPEYVKNDTAWIECPIEYKLDKSGEKKKASGCGHQFKYSERKRIKWDASKFIAYDNNDVINKVFKLPTYSPIVCVAGNTKVTIKKDGKISKEIISKLEGKNNFEILSYNQTKDIFEFKKPKACVLTNKQSYVNSIILENGKKIDVTDDHLFLTKRGYIKAKDLTEDDEIKIYTKKWCNLKKTIKLNTKQSVYDVVGIPDNHNFVANDIVVHNCDEAIRFACLTEDTLISMPRDLTKYPDGVPIRDLINKENFHVYSWNHKKNKLELSNCKGCFYVKDADVFEMELTTGKKIQATEDHKFHLMDGTVKEMKDLNELDKLKLKEIKCGRIKSITYIGKKPVYSLVEVSKNHNYFGNMLLLSNSGMEHNHAESKELKKLFTVIRPKRFWIFFAIPSIKWVDSKYREGMASFWLRILERGVGVLFEADKGVTKDIWHLKELEAAMGPIKFFTPMDKIKRNLMKHPCYFDMFKFPDLDEKTYDDYELVRNAVNLQRQVEEQSLSNKDIAKIAAYNLVHNWERIAVAIQRSKENNVTAGILADEIFFNPVVRKRTVSDVTIRSWVRGVQEYIKTKGDDSSGFDGAVSSETVNANDDAVSSDTVNTVDVPNTDITL